MKEYRVVKTTTGPHFSDSFERELNKWASEGWRIVGLHLNPKTEWFWFVAEREKQ